MPRPSTLNWEPSRSKWKVVYKGKKYRFEGGNGKSDREGKRRAEIAWKRKKAEIDQRAEQNKPYRAEYEKVIAEWSSVLAWAMDHGDGAMAATARDKITQLDVRMAAFAPDPITDASTSMNQSSMTWSTSLSLLGNIELLGCSSSRENWGTISTPSTLKKGYGEIGSHPKR